MAANGMLVADTSRLAPARRLGRTRRMVSVRASTTEAPASALALPLPARVAANEVMQVAAKPEAPPAPPPAQSGSLGVQVAGAAISAGALAFVGSVLGASLAKSSGRSLFEKPLTTAEVLGCQAKWATAIKGISKTYLDGGDYVGVAGEAAGELYGYGKHNVLFKPTKAKKFPFRPTGGEAMSYFVGNNAVEGGYEEDGGFAINGGKGFSEVVFSNHQIDLNGNTAIAMGTYDFTCATTGDVSTVEYSFGYKRCDDGKPRIFLHHSSVPYSTGAPAAAIDTPLTKEEVLGCQANWASAIKGISKTYLDGGDYVGVAGEAAGELYGYGKHNVLFKPTKAKKFPFRPTGGEAMSYFVGNNAVEGGYEEDGGFAINGGKGFSEVVFSNHQIDLNGTTAIAMGTYDFTCATTGDVSTVEYSFGYKRCDDGKPRIYLHHSSVPYAA